MEEEEGGAPLRGRADERSADSSTRCISMGMGGGHWALDKVHGGRGQKNTMRLIASDDPRP